MAGRETRRQTKKRRGDLAPPIFLLLSLRRAVTPALVPPLLPGPSFRGRGNFEKVTDSVIENLISASRSSSLFIM